MPLVDDAPIPKLRELGKCRLRHAKAERFSESHGNTSSSMLHQVRV